MDYPGIKYNHNLLTKLSFSELMAIRKFADQQKEFWDEIEDGQHEARHYELILDYLDDILHTRLENLFERKSKLKTLAEI